MKIGVLSLALFAGTALGTAQLAAECRHGAHCSNCGPQVIVRLVPAKHLPGFHKHDCCWHCLPPPRGPILESVAIERVAPPYLRTEVVVSREAFRVVLVVATGPQAVAPQAAPPAAQQTSAGSPQGACPANAGAGTSQATPQNGAATPPQVKQETTGDEKTIDQRLEALEKHMIELTRIMLEQRRSELERSQPAAAAEVR